MHLGSVRWVLGALPLVVVGCGGEDGRASSTTVNDSIASFTATATDSGTDASDSSPDSQGSNSESASGTGDTDADTTPIDDPKFDLGLQPDVTQEVEEGCTKVDFLFVVDNSGSMEDDQANLIANFPNFINGIQATLDDVDEYHVGVVTTDVYGSNAANCRLLGGLVVQTGGSASSNSVCGPYLAGANYMTEMDNLANSFACAAQVGTSGDGIERPMNAMEAAVRGDHAGAGQCNEGFLRDDALLVLVIITDEWDGPGDPEASGSNGDATQWFNTVVAAKGGIQENIVVVTLSHINGGACPPPDVFFNPADIQVFTEMFGDNGFQGCITGDFGQIFNDATAIIEDACNNFVPPG